MPRKESRNSDRKHRVQSRQFLKIPKTRQKKYNSHFWQKQKKSAAVEKNKRIYLTKGENKETLIKTKERIVSKAFLDAEQRLSSLRNDPKYPAVFSKLAQEAIESVGGEEFRIHIDKRDEKLMKRILSDMNLTGEIIADLQCSGGLVVSTRNESVTISNTLDSRLQRVKERKKLEVYSVMFGE